MRFGRAVSPAYAFGGLLAVNIVLALSTCPLHTAIAEDREVKEQTVTRLQTWILDSWRVQSLKSPKVTLLVTAMSADLTQCGHEQSTLLGSNFRVGLAASMWTNACSSMLLELVRVLRQSCQRGLDGAYTDGPRSKNSAPCSGIFTLEATWGRFVTGNRNPRTLHTGTS